MTKKFTAILENFINRGNNAGFSIRDVVKFVKNYKSNYFYKEAHPSIQKQIDEIANTDKRIRVINIKSSETIPGNSVVNDNSRGNGRLIEIAVEYAPYKTDNSKSVMIHPNMLEIIEADTPNLLPLPDAFNKKFDEYTKKFDSVDNKLYRRQAEDKGVLKDLNLNNPTKNIQISNANNGKVKSNIVSDSVQHNEQPLMESYIEELTK